MKQHWVEYLESIGIVDLYLERAAKVVFFYDLIYPGDIEHIFVSEYVDNDGQRQYETMWLFSTTDAMEARRFLHRVDYDATPLLGRIRYWRLTADDYEEGKASAKSRLTVNLGLSDGISGELKASGNNCDHLMTVFKQVIVPGLRAVTKSE